MNNEKKEKIKLNSIALTTANAYKKYASTILFYV